MSVPSGSYEKLRGSLRVQLRTLNDLIAENGKQGTSKFFTDVCGILRIHNAFSKIYHPQNNGEVERLNRTILASLRTYISDHPRDLDLYTSAFTYAYNTHTKI